MQHRRRRGRRSSCCQFTLLPRRRDRRAWSADHAAAPERREAQRRLAREVTALVHGADGGRRGRGGRRRAVRRRPRRRRRGRRSRRWPPRCPTADVGRGRLDGGVDLVDAARRDRRWPRSKGEARRLLEQGGVYVNGERADAERRGRRAPTCSHGRYVLLRRGKAATTWSSPADSPVEVDAVGRTPVGCPFASDAPYWTVRPADAPGTHGTNAPLGSACR